MDFNVETRRLDSSAAVVAVQGELDLYTAPRLQNALARAGDDGHTSLLVDLSRATFVDSTTLGVLMRSFHDLNESGGTLAIACHDPNLRRIFEITLLDQVFRVFATRAEGERYVAGVDTL